MIRRVHGDEHIDVNFRLIEFGSSAADDLTFDLDSYGAAEQFRVLSNLDAAIFLVDTRLRKNPADRFRFESVTASIEAAGLDPARIPFVFAVARAGLRPRSPHTLPALSELWSTPERPLMVFDSSSGLGAFEILDVAVDAALSARLAGKSSTGIRDVPIPEISPVDAPELFALRLNGLRQAVALGDWRGAAELLLVEWRATRARDLADLLDAIGYVQRSVRPENVGHEWWKHVCRQHRGEDLAMLLDSFILWERRAPAGRTAPSLEQHVRQTVERLEGLCWWGEDPRLTARLGSFLRDMTRYRKKAVHAAVCHVLARHRDPRSLDLYERYLAELRSIREPLGHRTTDLAESVYSAQFASRPREGIAIPGYLIVPARLQDAWQSLVERIRRPLPRAEDMEAVAADPKSDDVRREVAERMRERGDPRGEFVLLQLKKATDSLSPEEHEREQALKRTYAWDWLGPLADVVDVENSVFEKGYPVKLTVWTPNTRALADVVGKPEWATLREVRWGGDPCWEEEAPEPAIVEHPIMRSLEKVTTKMPEDPAELEALRRVAWAR